MPVSERELKEAKERLVNAKALVETCKSDFEALTWAELELKEAKKYVAYLRKLIRIEKSVRE